MPPPWIVRAVVLLFAAVMLSQAIWVSLAAFACTWLVVRGQTPLGTCADLTTRAREMYSEMLTGILALLLATRADPDK
jgi:hypothetical protein